MSSGSQEHQQKRRELLSELARELQQFNGLSASFFRAAAARIGVTVTDMQVIERLVSDGPLTAGQLAELTGLTTGAITGMINRLEEAGLVRRERDPQDARRVIVHLSSDTGQIRKIGDIFDFVRKAWDELAAQFDDEQVAFLVEFLKRGNAVARQEIVLLREAPAPEEGISSAPLGGLSSAQLVVSSGVTQLTVRADSHIAPLYQARFEGATPDVKAKGGVVTIRYPRRLLALEQRVADVTLSASIPWRILIQGGASVVTTELRGLNLIEMEVKGGMSMIRLELPSPSGVVPIRISGGASDINIRRPIGSAARAHLKGWVSFFVFDDQTFSNMGNDVWLQSADFDSTASHYSIEVASSASSVSITTS